MIDVKGLLETGLVNEKRFAAYPELKMYKYKNKVFYKNSWNTHSDIVECRGIVLDENNNVVSLPFRKVFNYKENNTTIRKDAVVKLVRKLNGFMAAFSLYNDQVLVSTTGSLDSKFTDLARNFVNLSAIKDILIGIQQTFRVTGTAIFEICHPDDPHIVDEKHGAYLIGFRLHGSGLLVPEEVLDRAAIASNAIHGEDTILRPEHTYCTFKTALRMTKECKHEGFMAYQKNSNKVVKLKSPHYLKKKFFMRMGTAKSEAMFKNPEEFQKNIDEEYYDIVSYITSNYLDFEWIGMTDQERKSLIEKWFDR